MTAALSVLCLTSSEKPTSGFLTAISPAPLWRRCAALIWLTLSGIARAGPLGVMHVFGSVVVWAFIGATLVGVYAFRPENEDAAAAGLALTD